MMKSSFPSYWYQIVIAPWLDLSHVADSRNGCPKSEVAVWSKVGYTVERVFFAGNRENKTAQKWIITNDKEQIKQKSWK